MEKLKELRDKTGAGISDCKKALEEAGNDIEKAIEILRRKGISKAAKRSDNEAKEGIVLVEANADKTEGYILEVNAETDFVVRNDRFQALANGIFTAMKQGAIADREALLEADMDGHKVKENLEHLSGLLGEKMEVKRIAILKGATVEAYSHMGGRIGVLVALDKPGMGDLAKDIAMHIAAANPKYLLPSEVSSEELEKEKSIYKDQLLKEGKPEAMLDKILEGKMGKFYGEICLLEQEYIKDDKKKVKEVCGDANVAGFVRFSL